jgi:hypothetical protein
MVHISTVTHTDSYELAFQHVHLCFEISSQTLVNKWGFKAAEVPSASLRQSPHISPTSGSESSEYSLVGSKEIADATL